MSNIIQPPFKINSGFESIELVHSAHFVEAQKAARKTISTETFATVG